MSKAGLKQIVICDAGSMATAPVNPMAIGLRDKASLEMAYFKEGKDYRDRILRNMINFKADVETLQPNLKLLKSLIGWADANCDVQMLTNPQTATAGSNDCFKFTGDKAIGFNFEYLMTGDKRSCKIGFERALEFEPAKTFIDTADSETPIAFAGITNDGADFTAYRPSYYAAFEAPKNTALFSAADIVERTLSIKSKGKKLQYNIDKIDYLTLTLTIKGRSAAIARIMTALNGSMSPSIYWKENNAPTFFDAFDINAGVLTQKEDVKIDDEDRVLSLTFAGDIPVFDVAFFFGATYGGDVSDTTGVKGGTVKIGY